MLVLVLEIEIEIEIVIGCYSVLSGSEMVLNFIAIGF